MNLVRPYVLPVLRRWPIVLAVALLALAGSAYWSFVVARTSWSATAALTTQSQNRAPEQDAVLSIGYVDYFNQAAYQQTLRAAAQIPAGVVLTAKTGAASPIIYIEASAPSEDLARKSAETAAETFRDDIRNSLVDERAREVRDLQAQVDEAVKQLQSPGVTSAEGNVILDQIRSLQGRITDISSDATNHLKRLQPVAGVASTSRNHVVDLATGAVGGLLLGLVAALALALLDGRVRRTDDLRRLDLTVLGELRRKQRPDDRRLALDRLVNALSVTDGPRASVVAVVGVGTGAAATRFARSLAGAAGARRAGAMLVRADVRSAAAAGPRGFAEFLAGGARLTDLVRPEADGVRVVPAGDLAGRDPFRAMDPDRVREFVAEARRACALTVVLAAPLEVAPESQVVCAAADRVVLVVERGSARIADLRQAVALLAEVGVTAGGAVLDDPTGPESPAEPTPVPEEPASTSVDRRPAVAVDAQTVTLPVTGPKEQPVAREPDSRLVGQTAARGRPAPSDGDGRRPAAK
ncbi:hypothetical protein ACQEVB_00275 [Pseudonocardia sp. CA-107938]|uniref:hypothetical protein n=1 Tax=Pseudonocardia sp. CA-107938 TaxID=3240021 RepID=UPI003D930893